MKISVFYEHLLEAVKQSGKTMEEVCILAVSYGISYVEIDYKVLFSDKDRILTLLKDTGLKIGCIYGFFDFGYDKDLQKGIDFVDFAESAGAKNIMPIPGFMKKMDHIPFIYRSRRENMRSIMEHICAYAKDRGITVCLEDFDDKIAPFATSKQLLWFMNHVKGLRCAFDTGNFLYSEEDAKAVLPMFEPYISYVHCKDRSLEYKKNENPKYTVKGRALYSSAVGYGCIPMEDIINRLLSIGYDGVFAIEHFGSCNQLEDIRLSAEWLQNL